MLCNLGSVSHSILRLFKIREHLVFILVPRIWHSAGHREDAEGLLVVRVSELHRCEQAATNTHTHTHTHTQTHDKSVNNRNNCSVKLLPPHRPI